MKLMKSQQDFKINFVLLTLVEKVYKQYEDYVNKFDEQFSRPAARMPQMFRDE